MNNNKENVPTGIFTNYIYKSIPLAFDESMSYYETLCGILDILKKYDNILVDYDETIIKLENYVRNYFENLDVQQEINNKLDEMVEDGTFDQIINTNITGSLSNLNTTDKSNLVNAINEVNNKTHEINVMIVHLHQNIGETELESFFDLPEGYTKDNCAIISYSSGVGLSKSTASNLSVGLTYRIRDQKSLLWIHHRDLNPELELEWNYYIVLMKVTYPEE